MGFKTREDVNAWAESNGGEAGLRQAKAAGIFGNELRTYALIDLWLGEAERARMEKRQTDALEATMHAATATERAAVAAEKSANWTKWAAIATAVGAFATLWQAKLTTDSAQACQTPPVPKASAPPVKYLTPPATVSKPGA